MENENKHTEDTNEFLQDKNSSSHTYLIHTYIHTYIHACMFTANIYLHTYTRTQRHTCIYSHMHTQTYVHKYQNTSIYRKGVTWIDHNPQSGNFLTTSLY